MRKILPRDYHVRKRKYFDVIVVVSGCYSIRGVTEVIFRLIYELVIQDSFMIEGTSFSLTKSSDNALLRRRMRLEVEFQIHCSRVITSIELAEETKQQRDSTKKTIYHHFPFEVEFRDLSLFPRTLHEPLR
jgi:hypothetical protein